MTGGGETARERERRVVLAHAPAGVRPAFAALLALDTALGRVLRTTREPIVGQMRLAWWRAALTELDDGPPPAEPVLAALAAAVTPRGVAGGALAVMTDGWEMLFAEPLDDNALDGFAVARGRGLFAAAATVFGGGGEEVGAAGEGWALADLAGHVGDPAIAARARAKAADRLARAFATRWPAALRPLGMLAVLARADLAGQAAGSPRRLGRLLLHRWSGR